MNIPNDILLFSRSLVFICFYKVAQPEYRKWAIKTLPQKQNYFVFIVFLFQGLEVNITWNGKGVFHTKITGAN